MWIFTQFGFFSLVQHRAKPETLLVRGRVKSDLVAFAHRCRLPASSVIELDDADYRFRIEVPRAVAAEALEKATGEIDYDNFKDRVAETQGHGRADVYLRVWSDVRRLKP